MLVIVFAAAAVQAAPAAPPPPVEEGRVVLQCRVARTGGVTDCTVVEETPAGRGFSALALQASKELRMPPNVRKAGGTVRVPMRLTIDNQPPPRGG